MPAKRRWESIPRSRTPARGIKAKTPPIKGRRDSAYGLRITFDIAELEEFAKRLTKESELARPALVKAHRDLAGALAANITKALKDKIEERGRVQREGALVAALDVERNPGAVVATNTGFTFGFLETAKGNVRLYARNLELGTPVHIGQPFNAFRNAAGDLVPPMRGGPEVQIDPKLVAFRDLGRRRKANDYAAEDGGEYDSKGRYTRVRNKKKYVGRGEMRQMPVFFIKHEIKPYLYFQTGMREFRKGNLLGVSNFQDMVLGIYEGYFEDAGLNFYLRWFLNYQSISPGSGMVALRRQIGRKTRASEAAWI